jgi:regulator of sigma E protease
MTALLGIILAFMNIIPIPGLDGGYILFILVEMITGKKPSDKFLSVANTIGFAFLIVLMVYALGLDFKRFIFK